MDIFCKIMNGEIPSRTLYEDEIVKVILDIDPQGTGHSLIIPKKHFVDLHDIELDTLTHIMKIAKTIIKLLEEKLNPDSVILVQNNGKEEVVKHYHLHLIPKYDNDPKLELDKVYEILTK